MERTKKEIDMDYEQKYNEALGWMRQLYPCLYGQFREDAEHFFPELKESGDEWFIKELQGFLESYGADYFGTDEWQKFHAWLENQKEPHYTKRNALFDKCVANCDPEIMKKVSDEVDEKLKEQKPAEWSEEDEYYMDAIITIINRETALYPKGGGTESFNNDLIDWLKSLRPHWKPSEEQMNALYDVIHPCDPVDKEQLESLYEQLKKL